MGTFKNPEKQPVQRVSQQDDAHLAKSVNPPSFALDASGQQSPVQRQEAGVALESKNAPQTEITSSPEQEANQTAPKSEGELLRDTILEQAESWVNKEFISQDEIDKVRLETGLKNYTTCIEFAGKMMREGTKEFYGKEWKKAAATSQMMIQIKSQWELAVGARNQAGMFQKSVELFDEGIKRIEGQKGTVEADIANLRAAQEEGESDLAFKQRLKRADLLEKHTVGALNSVIRMLNGQKAKFQKKVDGNMEKADEMDANNHAMVKLDGPLGEKRPNLGEYIIMAQAGKGDKYGVNQNSQVFLAGGSFKHIAVFGGVVKPDDGSGYELWRTIDGGGTKGKETLLRVRLSDRMIFHGQEGAKLPDAGSASGSQLAGWIDMEKLVEMRDEKMAQSKK